MPTTRPRYQVTDAGEVRELLDVAQARWPEIGDRKQLLLELARRGAATLETEPVNPFLALLGSFSGLPLTADEIRERHREDERIAERRKSA